MNYFLLITARATAASSNPTSLNVTRKEPRLVNIIPVNARQDTTAA